MRRGSDPVPPIVAEQPTSIPLAVTIFLLGLLGLWLSSLIVPPLMDDLANTPVAQTCWANHTSAQMPVSALPTCTALKLRQLEQFAAETLSHPDADELAVAHGGTTGEWLSALAQAIFNLLVLAALVLGLAGLWATLAVRLSRRLWVPRRPEGDPWGDP